MGLWQSKVKKEVVPVIDLSVASATASVIPIRHRPTCLSADLEKGVLEETDNDENVNTKS